MDRIGNRASHQYVLANEAAADPGRHPIGTAYSEQADAQLTPPSPNKDASHVVQEVQPGPRASSFDRTRHACEKYWLTKAASYLVALGILVAIVCLL